MQWHVGLRRMPFYIIIILCYYYFYSTIVSKSDYNNVSIYFYSQLKNSTNIVRVNYITYIRYDSIIKPIYVGLSNYLMSSTQRKVHFGYL